MIENQAAGHRERMKNKYFDSGDSAFYDYQLLEMLLFFSIPRRDTKPIAKELLEVFGSMDDLLNASIERITSVKGVGSETARLIKLAGDVYKRSLDSREKQTAISGIKEAGICFKKLLENEPTEKFAVILLNNGGRIQYSGILGECSMENADVPIMKLVELISSRRASSVVIAHNHPNGLAEPSAADISKTLMLIDFVDKLNTVLADHVIIGSNGIYSMRCDPERNHYFSKNST